MHMLYTPYRRLSPQLSPLLGELERRARAHPEAVGVLLEECHAAWMKERRAVVGGWVAEEVTVLRRGVDGGGGGSGGVVELVSILL